VLGGEAVRLFRGDYDTVVSRAGEPCRLVAAYADAGARLIHVVDLEGARGGGVRPGRIASLAEAAAPARLQVGGGIRSLADAWALVDAGAARVVVGTAAFGEDDALRAFADELGEALVVSLDVGGDTVRVGGWLASTGIGAAEAAARCAEAGIRRLACTAIARDGTLAGPDLDLLRSVLEAARLPLLAAGGVRGAADLDALERLGCEGAIVGRALLEGGVPLALLSGR